MGIYVSMQYDHYEHLCVYAVWPLEKEGTYKVILHAIMWSHSRYGLRLLGLLVLLVLALPLRSLSPFLQSCMMHRPLNFPPAEMKILFESPVHVLVWRKYMVWVHIFNCIHHCRPYIHENWGGYGPHNDVAGQPHHCLFVVWHWFLEPWERVIPRWNPGLWKDLGDMWRKWAERGWGRLVYQMFFFRYTLLFELLTSCCLAVKKSGWKR